VSISEAPHVSRLFSAISAETLAVLLPLFLTGVGVAALTFSSQTYGMAHHLLMIIGMTLAMMSAFAIPLCRAVAGATLWWHAPTTVVVALLAFLAVWMFAASFLHLAVGVLATLVSPPLAALMIMVCCAASQIGSRRAVLLASCQLTRPVRPGYHVRGAAVWAGLAAGRCVRVCALPMALTAVAPSMASLVLVTAMLWFERVAHRPQLRLWLALGYLGIGTLLMIMSGTTLMPPTGHHSGH
jgi:hypothetical protein